MKTDKRKERNMEGKNKRGRKKYDKKKQNLKMKKYKKEMKMTKREMKVPEKSMKWWRKLKEKLGREEKREEKGTAGDGNKRKRKGKVEILKWNGWKEKRIE